MFFCPFSHYVSIAYGHYLSKLRKALFIASICELGIPIAFAIDCHWLTLLITVAMISSARSFFILKYSATSFAKSKFSELSVSEIFNFNPVLVDTGFKSYAGDKYQPCADNRNPWFRK